MLQDENFDEALNLLDQGHSEEIKLDVLLYNPVLHVAKDKVYYHTPNSDKKKLITRMYYDTGMMSMSCLAFSFFRKKNPYAKQLSIVFSLNI